MEALTHRAHAFTHSLAHSPDHTRRSILSSVVEMGGGNGSARAVGDRARLLGHGAAVGVLVVVVLVGIVLTGDTGLGPGPWSSCRDKPATAVQGSAAAV